MRSKKIHTFLLFLVFPFFLPFFFFFFLGVERFLFLPCFFFIYFSFSFVILASASPFRVFFFFLSPLTFRQESRSRDKNHRTEEAKEIKPILRYTHDINMNVGIIPLLTSRTLCSWERSSDYQRFILRFNPYS